MAEPSIRISIRSADGSALEVSARKGISLREALLESGVSLYQGKFRITNCRGLGICGSCKVNVLESGTWWNRRSCQIKVTKNLEIELVTSGPNSR